MQFNLPVVRDRKCGLYIHYPFCIQKCDYCDFFSLAEGREKSLQEEEIFRSYKAEMVSRLRENPELRDLEFDTIFFGGGTPSRMNPELVKDFFEFLNWNITIQPNSEISIEMNSEDVTSEALDIWREIGFNRLNIGIQTFSPRLLRFLGRHYDEEKYKTVLDTVKSSKLQNYGFDLIYGIPSQTEEEFHIDLKKIQNSGANHISVYSLTVEKGTEYRRQISDGIKSPPDEELQSGLLLRIPEAMSESGFQQYEISNYSKNQAVSRHNLKYWTYGPYLALGPGAHGFLPRGRYANKRSLGRYLESKWENEYEVPEPEKEIILSLFRVFLPIDISSFLEIFSLQSIPKIEKVLNGFAERGIATYQSGIFQWNTSAVLFLDSYILELYSALD